MPIKATDPEGNEIEVPTPEERAAEDTKRQEEVAALNKKIEDAEKARKELEQEVNPNWKEARKKEKTLEQEIAVLTNKLQQAGVEHKEKPLTHGDAEKIAESKTKEMANNLHRDDLIARFPADKRAVIRTYFDKLSRGDGYQELTRDEISDLVKSSARAAGLGREIDPDMRSMNYSPGSGVNVERSENKQDFTETDAGKGLASALNLTQARPPESKDKSHNPKW